MLRRSVTQTPVGACWVRLPKQRVQHGWKCVRRCSGAPVSFLQSIQCPHRHASSSSPCPSSSGCTLFPYSSALDSHVTSSYMRPVSTEIRPSKPEDTMNTFQRSCIIAPALFYRVLYAAALSPVPSHKLGHVSHRNAELNVRGWPSAMQNHNQAYPWTGHSFEAALTLDRLLSSACMHCQNRPFSGTTTHRRDFSTYWTGCAELTEDQADAAVTAALEVLIKDVEEDLADKRERLKLLRQRHGKAKLGDVTVQNVVGGGSPYGGSRSTSIEIIAGLSLSSFPSSPLHHRFIPFENSDLRAPSTAGMRNLIGLLTETSVLDPQKGITYRGYTIDQLVEKLPRFAGEEYPPVEGVIWLLLTGRLPSAEKAQLLSAALTALSCSSSPRAAAATTSSHFIPPHAHEALEALPISVHPMTQLVVGVASLQPCSRLAAAYQQKAKKDSLWKYALYDALSLIAKTAVLAARIYQRSFKPQAEFPRPQPGLDWGANFAAMLGFKDTEAFELIRLYLLLHADHEGGNVSAHTAHVVESALSDLYLSYSAGLSGLAGPLHGLANQECLKWLQHAHEELRGEQPTPEKVERIAKQTLSKGQVIPGYGHAVLRVTDPRFLAQRKFALKHLKGDELFALLDVAYKTIPKVLLETGKVQNPYPNVDCHSGVLLHHYGLKESNFYTVMFGIARAIGIAAQHVSSRGLMMPIERPKSITIEQLEEKVEQLQAKA